MVVASVKKGKPELRKKSRPIGLLRFKQYSDISFQQCPLSSSVNGNHGAEEMAFGFTSRFEFVSLIFRYI